MIGLDSADRRYLWRLMEAGDLPHVQGLVRRGRTGVVRSPPGMGDDAIWASFSAAAPPGRHGRFFWKSLVPGTYDMRGFGDGRASVGPFWEPIAAAGHRVAVIDVPKSPLSELPGGFQLSDWLVHGRDGATRSRPPEVAAQILARFGDDRIDRPGTDDFLCREHALPPEMHAEFLARLAHGLDAKRRATVEFLAQGGWDLYLTVFKECHCVGHEFWDRVDLSPGAPVDDNPVRDVYRALDAAVGELLELVDDETHVLLFSGLGMDANYTAEHLLDRALLRLEPGLPRLFADAYPRLLDLEERIRGRLAPGARGSFVRRLRHAYQVEHNELSGAVRFNVRGREPSGRVRPGADLARWTDRIEAALMELVDPESGEPVVDRVIRSDDAYPGEGRDALPDLFVVWKRDRPITGLASDAIGVVRADDPGYRSGNHVGDGFFVLAGPAVASPGAGEPVSITDLGPTIAALLDLQLPQATGRPVV